MTLSVERLITLCVGIVIGAAIVLVFGQFPNEPEDVNVIRDPEVTVDEDSTAEETPIQAISINAETRTTQPKVSPARPEGEIEPDANTSPISLPEIYENHINPQQRTVSFSDIHEIFKSEPRDESWALAMESGINHYIANSQSGEWAVVEYVECRSRICEIAGYMSGDQSPVGDLLADFIGSGVWPGTLRTHSSQFSDRETNRFITIINGYRNDEYPILFPP